VSCLRIKTKEYIESERLRACRTATHSEFNGTEEHASIKTPAIEQVPKQSYSDAPCSGSPSNRRSAVQMGNTMGLPGNKRWQKAHESFFFGWVSL
jgi:hypothetical protein